jgi:hypothetical protein
MFPSGRVQRVIHRNRLRVSSWSFCGALRFASTAAGEALLASWNLADNK